MPVRKRHMTRKTWTDDHLRQLRSGIDFFQSAWGSESRWPRESREEWPGEAALAEMADCWREHGAELIEAERQKYGDDSMPLWFELVLDGMNPSEARQLHRERSYERAAVADARRKILDTN